MDENRLRLSSLFFSLYYYYEKERKILSSSNLDNQKRLEKNIKIHHMLILLPYQENTKSILFLFLNCLLKKYDILMGRKPNGVPGACTTTISHGNFYSFCNFFFSLIKNRSNFFCKKKRRGGIRNETWRNVFNIFISFKKEEWREKKMFIGLYWKSKILSEGIIINFYRRFIGFSFELFALLHGRFL